MLDNENSMELIVELNYHQLFNRLRFLSRQYSKFTMCVNCDSEYSPIDILCRARFEFNDTIYLCYKTALKGEKHLGVKCSTEAFNLGFLSNELLKQEVLIVSNDNKTYSVCGVYIDEDNERIVLLNGYHNGNKVDWSYLSGGIY